jgi:uncharacterized membrane protein YoaK (UPF0700 family)
MPFIQDLPLMLGEALGFSPSTAQYVGGMLLSMAVLCAVTLAFSAILGKRRGSENSNMIVTSMSLFVTMGALFLIGWMPFVFLVIAVIVVALLFGSSAKKGLFG